MTWTVTGSSAHGKRGTMTAVGLDTEDAVRRHMKSTYPDFTVDAVEPGNKPATKPAVAEAPTKARKEVLNSNQ